MRHLTKSNDWITDIILLRIASNIAKLPDNDLDELAATSPLSVGFHAPRAHAAR
jgi:hypothetical protein